jgi:hypothetical protein
MTNSISNNTAVTETAAVETTKKTKVTTGKTIGNPELSEKAQKYYEQLKEKFGDMEFILVDPSLKQQAEANASAYASPNKTVVLIDSDKIEQMAEDEDYREKYEGIISSAKSQISQLAEQLMASGTSVKGYGMQVNDGGTASFFAVIDKSQEAQKERIEKKAEEKAAQKKEDAKKAEEKRAEKKAEQKAEEKKKAEKAEDEDTVTIKASSIEELLQKINDYTFMDRSNYVETEAEKQVGRNIDFSV